MSQAGAHVPANVDRFSGFADLYDRYRPRPPAILLDVLSQLAAVERPRLVVDIGSGTGLSTLLWAERAVEVVGVEPNGDMRAVAERRAADLGGTAQVRFVQGYSGATGLADRSADIVTVSQALHWMEPEATFREVRRVLRPGGVFAAYDCDWPPTLHWEAEAAYDVVGEREELLDLEQGVSRDVRFWDKDGHLDRMRDSGQFRYCKEMVVHHIEQGDADRLVGIARSQGGIAALLKRGVTDEQLGLDHLRQVAERTIGAQAVPWYWSYRVRLGIA